jgi:hypothetical protein
VHFYVKVFFLISQQKITGSNFRTGNVSKKIPFLFVTAPRTSGAAGATTATAPGFLFLLSDRMNTRYHNQNQNN